MIDFYCNNLIILMASENQVTFSDKVNVCKQLYYKSSYADFKPDADPSTFKIKFNLTTSSRLLISNVRAAPSENDYALKDTLNNF